MNENKKQSVLKRDNYKCRNCSATSNLEVHHILGQEELELMNSIYDDPLDKELVKALDSPEYCITLCVPCHSTTYFNSAPTVLYTQEEQAELKATGQQWKQIELERIMLKNVYRGLSKTEAYKVKKHKIDKATDELIKRIYEIKSKMGIEGKIRLDARRQEVIRLCDNQLLRVTSPDLFEDKELFK
ncbi:HNH endonuclease [Chloroflexota bacterium]